MQPPGNLEGLTYDDFELSLGYVNNRLTAKVTASPFGAFKQINVKLPETLNQKFLSDSLKKQRMAIPIAARTKKGIWKAKPMRGIRSVSSSTIEGLTKTGGELFSNVFVSDVQTAYAKCLGRIANDAKKRLRIRIRFDALDTPAVAELLRYPWEVLYDDTDHQSIELKQSIMITRYLGLQAAELEPVQVQGPLKVLVIYSDPRDYPRLYSAENEIKSLVKNLKDGHGGTNIELDVLPKASLQALSDRLAQQDYHVIHFVGHGGVSDDGQGILIFKGDDNKGVDEIA